MLVGCGAASASKTETQTENKLEQISTEIQGDLAEEETRLTYTHSLDLQYAKQFRVDYYDGGYACICISDGSRCLIVPEHAEIPEGLDADIVVLQQPIQNIYLAATASMCLFDALDGLDAISYSSLQADSWYVDGARQAMENGKILFAGKYSEPDYEMLVSNGCTLALESTMIYHTPDVKEKLQELGIPVLTDWASYETHPLGRTEWIKLYAVMLGKEEEANRLFQEQVEYANSVDAEDTGKTVAFFYLSTSGYAVVRKPGDYLTKMIDLAGGNYIFTDLGGDESASTTVSMEMERFYAAAKDADYFIYNGTLDDTVTSLDELLDKNELLADFKAVQEQNVWCTNKNVYQETTQFGKMIAQMNQIFAGTAEDDLEFFYRLK